MNEPVALPLPSPRGHVLVTSLDWDEDRTHHLSGSQQRAGAEAFEADMIFDDRAHLLDGWKNL